MADGLSTAASVAGLVSLGIQVCSGIATYLDGIKCRADELESARKYEQNLKASMKAIENVLPRFTFHHQESSAAITARIQPCKDELKALERVVAELCDEKTVNPTLLDRAKASKKRFTYAFDRPKLSQLQVNIGQVIQSLQLALQILGLEDSSLLGDTLRTIESTSNGTAADITATKAEVTALADNVSILRNEGPFIRAAIERISPSLLDLEQTATTAVQRIQMVREDTNRATHLLATEMQLIRNQLATIQSLNTIGQSATTQRLQRMQEDQKRLFSHMIAKPSYLEEISESCFDIGPSARTPRNANISLAPVLTTTVSDRESLGSIRPLHYARRCTCRPRQRLQRRQVLWSGLLFFQDDVYSENHFPTCQFWQWTPAERKWGLRHRGLGWLAQKAIEITFSYKSGAGGASFSPNFTYYPTVNQDVAPAFQILQIIGEAGKFHNLFGAKWSFSDWQYLLESGLRTVAALFREGKASPKDVNIRNETLIYQISDTIQGLFYVKPCHGVDPTPYREMVFNFLSDLLGLGIPVDVYNTMGDSPMFQILWRPHDWWVEGVEIIYGTAANVPSVTNGAIGARLLDLITLVQLQRDSRIIAEASGCAQLSQAVLIGDTKQVETILKKKHPGILEVNRSGQTPLHLSVTQPSVLQLLLPVYSPSQLNTPDTSGFTTLHYAAALSWNCCRKDRGFDKRCRKCHCARQTKMLLKADCAVDISNFACLTHWNQTSYDISPRCRAILIRGLKDRRHRLKQLARRFLSDSEIVALHLESENVLDSQARAVLRLLEAKGITIPPALKLTERPAFTTGYPGISVYHVAQSPEEADLFWAHNFQDVDEFNGHFHEVMRDGFPPIATCRDPAMILWLIDHGANLYRELNPFNCGADRQALSVRSAHIVYRRIGQIAWHYDYQLPPRILSLLHPPVLPIDIFDKCDCSCSKKGCTPFLMLIKALGCVPTLAMKSIEIEDPFLWLLGEVSHGFTESEYKEAVRYFTFTALDMSHTCYHEPGNCEITCSVTFDMCEEVMHIRDEQAGMIELLEKILLDLDEEMDAIMEEEEDFDMRKFLMDHWLVRVEKELEAISGHKLPEDFKRETEALGVVWDEMKETDSEPESDDDCHHRLQYWLNKIEQAAQL